MTNRTPRKWYQRPQVYLIAGLVVGFSLMILPVLMHTTLGPASPFETTFAPPSVVDLQRITSPVDFALELIWLVVPAILLILVLYYIAGRRKRWKGYDDAVRYPRH